MTISSLSPSQSAAASQSTTATSSASSPSAVTTDTSQLFSDISSGNKDATKTDVVHLRADLKSQYIAASTSSAQSIVAGVSALAAGAPSQDPLSLLNSDFSQLASTGTLFSATV